MDQPPLHPASFPVFLAKKAKIFLLVTRSVRAGGAVSLPSLLSLVPRTPDPTRRDPHDTATVCTPIQTTSAFTQEPCLPSVLGESGRAAVFSFALAAAAALLRYYGLRAVARDLLSFFLFLFPVFLNETHSITHPDFVQGTRHNGDHVVPSVFVQCATQKSMVVGDSNADDARLNGTTGR